ncbi:hypothetical protein JVT61DRAFT_12123 [Boletus reticuloceps]|uniref:Uncharacterized protein n=1 Tax=Boletus reticuloceps TaxID=495285 RepID=A0A8I2YEG9_9AGAM|nr:hypothetical protein JVT61DRAFT_12123 [Boletus reticuloceps]
MYPNYVYRPQRSKDRKGKKGQRGNEGDSETSISFVLPLCVPAVGNNHGRSSSAPTPLPRQTIQIPSVCMPSCPTSPSMVPMTNRRASHPDHGSSSSSQFDFVASNTAIPQQQYSPSEVFPEVSRLSGFEWMVPSSLRIGQWSLSRNARIPAPSVDTKRHVHGPSPPNGHTCVGQFRIRAIFTGVVDILSHELRAN